MPGIDLANVMDGIALNLMEIDGLRVYAWPVESATAPFAVVTYPTGDILMGTTFNRGADEFQFEVHVGVGSVYGKASRNLLAAYVTAGSPKEIKAAIEADPTLGGTVDDLQVSSCEISFMELGGNIYLAASYTIDVIA